MAMVSSNFLHGNNHLLILSKVLIPNEDLHAENYTILPLINAKDT